MVESTPTGDADAGAEALLGLAAGSPQVRLPRMSTFSPHNNNQDDHNHTTKHPPLPSPDTMAQQSQTQQHYISTHHPQHPQHPPLHQLASTLNSHPSERLPRINLFNTPYQPLQTQINDQISHTHHPSQIPLHSSLSHSSQQRPQSSWNVSTTTTTPSMLPPLLPTPRLVPTSSLTNPSYPSYNTTQWPSSNVDYSYPSHQQQQPYSYYNSHHSTIPGPQQPSSHDAQSSLPIQHLPTQSSAPPPLQLPYPHTTSQNTAPPIRPSLAIPHVTNHSDKYYMDYQTQITPLRTEPLPSLRETAQTPIMFPGDTSTSTYPSTTSIQPFPPLSAPNLPSVSQTAVKVDAPVPPTNSLAATKPETPPPPSRARGLADLINPTDTMPGSSVSMAPLGMTVQPTANKSILNPENMNDNKIPQSNQLHVTVPNGNQVEKESEIKQATSVMADSNHEQQSSSVKVSSNTDNLRIGDKSNALAQSDKSNQSQVNTKKNGNDSITNGSRDLPISPRTESRKMPYDPITDSQPSETPKQKKRPPYHRTLLEIFQSPIQEPNLRNSAYSVHHSTKFPKELNNVHIGDENRKTDSVLSAERNGIPLSQQASNRTVKKPSDKSLPKDFSAPTHKTESSSTPEEHENDKEGSENGEETRCPCGSQANDGIMVACDQCNTWQHGKCMGFRRNSDLPQTYYCHICRPEEMRPTCIAHPKYKERYGTKEKELKMLRRESEEKLAVIKPTELRRILQADLRDRKTLSRQPLSDIFNRYATLLRNHFLKHKQSMIEGLRIVFELPRQEIAERLDKASKKLRHMVSPKFSDDIPEKHFPTSSSPKDRMSMESVTNKTPNIKIPSQKRVRPASMNFDTTSPNGTIRSDGTLNADSVSEAEAFASDTGNSRTMSREERKLQQTMKLFAMMEEREREKKKARMRETGSSPKLTQHGRPKTPRISTSPKLSSPQTPTRAISVETDDVKLNSPKPQLTPNFSKPDPLPAHRQKSFSPMIDIPDAELSKDHIRRERHRDSSERGSQKRRDAASPETPTTNGHGRRKSLLPRDKPQATKRRRMGSSKDLEEDLNDMESKSNREPTNDFQIFVPGPSVLGSKLAPTMSILEKENHKRVAEIIQKKAQRKEKSWIRKEWILSFPQMGPRTKGSIARDGPMRKRNLARQDPNRMAVLGFQKSEPSSSGLPSLTDEPKTMSVSMVVVSEKTSLPDNGKKLESSRLVLSDSNKNTKAAESSETTMKTFCPKKRFASRSLPSHKETSSKAAEPKVEKQEKKDDEPKEIANDVNKSDVKKTDTAVNSKSENDASNDLTPPVAVKSEDETNEVNENESRDVTMSKSLIQDALPSTKDAEPEQQSATEKVEPILQSERHKEHHPIISSKDSKSVSFALSTASDSVQINEKKNIERHPKEQDRKDENVPNTGDKDKVASESSPLKSAVAKAPETIKVAQPILTSQVPQSHPPLRSKVATPTLGLGLRSCRAMPASTPRSQESIMGGQVKPLRSIAPETNAKDSLTAAEESTRTGLESIVMKRLEGGLLKPSASSPAIPTVSNVSHPARPAVSRQPPAHEPYSRNPREMKHLNLNGFHRPHGPGFRGKPPGDGPPWGSLPSFSTRRPAFKPGPSRPYMNGTRSPPRHGMGGPPHRSEHFRPIGPREKIRGGRMDDHWSNMAPSPSRWNNHGPRGGWGSGRKGYNSGDHYGRGGRRGRHGSA